MTVASFKGRKILCIGDVMLDRYVYGSVDRISPEAPVPVLHASHEENRLGGSGTVIRNIASLGGEVVFISVIGNDNEGHKVTGLVGQIPNVMPYLITDNERITTVKIRHISGNHQVSRVDYETGLPVSDRIVEQIISYVKSNIDGCDAIALSDYGKGVLTRSLIADIVVLAGNRPIIVDPKSYDFTMYSGTTVLTPNLPELFKAALFSPDVPENMKQSKDVVALAKLLMRPVSSMLATRGKDGMTVIDRDGVDRHISSTAKEVYDVTGAGDTVVAVLSLGMAAGLSLYDAAYIANAAAGIVVGKVGTATVNPEELSSVL